MRTADYRRTILAFDGGGIRGLFQASLIAELHRRTGLLNHIDVFAGTSTGAIMAVALALDASRFAEIADLYINLGKSVFCRKRDIWRRVFPFAARYSSSALRSQLSPFFPNDKREFSKCPKQCLIPSVSLARHGVEIFDSLDSECGKMDSVDIVLASCAAPTYFIPHRIDRSYYVDGGLGCNNPAFHAANHIRATGESPDCLRVLSIGTYSFVKPSGLWLSRYRPSASWARLAISICMDASSGIADQYCETLLGERYLRIDGRFGVPVHIPLDDYRKAVEFLPQFASEIGQASKTLDLVKAWLAS